MRLDSGQQRELDRHQFRKLWQRERGGQLHGCGEQQLQPPARPNRVRLLRDATLIEKEWLPHYRRFGMSYPLRATLASGTHSDISLKSSAQARGFTDAISAYNRQTGAKPKLVNATLPQFFRAVDDSQSDTPFLETLRGCFGHSWDLWPVSLAKYAADMRAGERAFLAAETLLAVANGITGRLAEATRAERIAQLRAEWQPVHEQVLASGGLVFLLHGGTSDPRKSLTGLRETPALQVIRDMGHGHGVTAAAGADAANGCIIDSFVIPNVHPDVFVALGRTQPVEPTGALGILESFNVATLIEGADAAAKAAAVQLLEIRLAMALGGKAFVTLTGDVASVQTAVAAGRQVISEAGVLVNAVVISRPHPDVYHEVV